MPHLVSYGLLNASNNSMAGNLVKAQCDICGEKYGSIEEAKLCEAEHVMELIKGKIENDRCK